MSADSDKSLSYRGKTVVRTIGTILVSTCCVMVVLGVTILSDRLKGPQFVLYWSWCFLITIGTLLTALFDLMMVRRASRQTRRRLYREQFLADQSSKEDDP